MRVAIGLAVLLTTGLANAGDIGPAGHIAVGVGGATRDPSFRLALDAAVGVASGEPYDRDLWTFTGGVVTGFGHWPTYIVADVGHGFGTRDGWLALLGGIVTLGPAFRVDPSTGVGGDLHLRLYVGIVQVGIHSVVIGTNGAEGQFQLTFGAGRL